jgi:hypothetical protein
MSVSWLKLNLKMAYECELVEVGLPAVFACYLDLGHCLVGQLVHPVPFFGELLLRVSKISSA